MFLICLLFKLFQKVKIEVFVLRPAWGDILRLLLSSNRNNFYITRTYPARDVSSLSTDIKNTKAEN